jgi:hypothetical protein
MRIKIPNSKGYVIFNLSIRLVGNRPNFSRNLPYVSLSNVLPVGQTLCALGLIVVWLLPLPIQAATYYVSPAGSDSNPGTQNAPLQHLSVAAAMAGNPGDTVIALDGTYNSEGVVTTAQSVSSVVVLHHSGAPGMPITFRALNRGGAILDAGNTSSSACNGAWAYFDVGNVSYIVIQGFVIQNGCYNGIRSNGSAHNVTIRWNEIRYIGNWANPAGPSSPSGTYLNSSEYAFTFDGNLFHDIGGGSNTNQQHAIYTSGSMVTVVNNIFYNLAHGWAIQTAGGNGVLIANNTFAFPNPNRTGQVELWDGGDPGSLANVTIRNNIFYQPTDIAVVTTLSAPMGGGCSIDHNLTTVGQMYDGGSPCTVATNLTGTDPMLADVATTPYDFRLLAGSPAIGAGIPVTAAAVDFYGIPRLMEGAFDVGACAFSPSALASRRKPNKLSRCVE